jgi:hypothetical protein
MDRDHQSNKPNRYTLLLIILICFLISLFSACDLKIQIPSLFPPKKSDLKRLIAADLPHTETHKVAFKDDDLTVTFFNTITTHGITTVMLGIFDALDNHAEAGTIVINDRSFNLKSSSASSSASIFVLNTIIEQFTDPSKEEISFIATIKYRNEWFTFKGELVFYDIYRKMIAPISSSEIFLTTHNDALELKEGSITFSDSILILKALHNYLSLPTETKRLLTAEESTLVSLEQALLNTLTSDELAAYLVIKMIVAIPPLDDLNITDRNFVNETMDAYDELTPDQQLLVENSHILAEAYDIVSKYSQTIDMIGDEVRNGLYIVNRNVSANNLGLVPIGTVPLYIDGVDVSCKYSFKFFDPDNKTTEIDTFDLSQGATTCIAYMEATPTLRGYNSVTATVVFKYGSVSFRGDDRQYTIEDAINQAGAREIIVTFNTSFATPEIAELVYGSVSHRIGSQTTLLLPADSEYSSAVTESATPTKSEQGPFVQLRIPGGITLSVKGTLIVNAKRASDSTKHQGFVAKPYYSILQIEETAVVKVEHRGVLRVLGFAVGQGSIMAESGSTVHESLYISSFRGGTITTEIMNSVFPFDQFSANQIECTLSIESGASYVANAFLYVSSSYTPAQFKLIGPDSVITLEGGGSIKKSFDPNNGQIKIALDGNVQINNGSINIWIFTADTNNKPIPFDGRWHFIVNSGHVQINSIVALLPGSSFTIKPSASVSVEKSGGLIIFDPDFYEDYLDYGKDTEVSNYYRIPPTIGYDKSNEATFTNDGNLIVKGRIGGSVQGSGVKTIESTATQNIKYGFVVNEVGSNKKVVDHRLLEYHQQ